MPHVRNGAPMVYDQGTRDLSTRQVPRSGTDQPQHLPKIYGFFEKGPIGPNYVDLGQTPITEVYGDKSFDVNSKYYTHATPFLQETVAAGNNCVVHRLVAPDAQDKANKALYLDIVADQVPLYQKNGDGSLKLDDVTGEPMPVLDGSGNPITVAGYKVGFVEKFVEAPIGEYQPGQLTEVSGIQTATGGAQSTQIPLFEFYAADAGEDGMNLGIKIQAVAADDISGFPHQLLSNAKNYPYYFSMVRVMDEVTGLTNPVLNAFGSEKGTFVIEKGAINPASGAVVDTVKIVNDLFVDANSGLGGVYVYDANLKRVLEDLYAAESIIEDSNRDAEVNVLENNIYALNIASFTSSNGSPYQAIKLQDLSGGVRLTRNTNIFLEGANDGTISEELLDTMVAADMANYTNELHEYNDLVAHPESIVYDSGFGLETKLALAKIISRRKDTFCVMATYAHDDAALTLDQQFSKAIALKTALDLYPESATFATSVRRGMVMGGSGEIINSLYNKRVPTSFEVLAKAARYMGASNGAWKSGALFDRAPGSIVTRLKNLDVTWVPASTRSRLWDVGMNYALNYKIREQFFPALKTVCEDDTSVMNSFFVGMAVCTLNKVGHAAWREFSGNVKLTPSELTEAINNFVDEKVKDIFDNMFVIKPDTHLTELDSIRGYSFTIPIKIYAPNMTTVATLRTEAYRITDLEG